MQQRNAVARGIGEGTVREIKEGDKRNSEVSIQLPFLHPTRHVIPNKLVTGLDDFDLFAD